MASITAVTTAPAITRAAFYRKASAGASAPLIQGLPQIRLKRGRIQCSAKDVTTSNSTGVCLAAVAASMVGASGSAVALVDERMSTEGTGLSLGLSNNLLGWILLGVFALIWSLYFVYTSTLEEDEESGLSL